MDKTVYLGLGCNLGNRLKSLKRALELLESLGSVTAISKIYESGAWGYEDDRSYLNLCCSILTDLNYEAFHQKTLDIEVTLGRETIKRKQGEPYSARRMDIDILFFGDEEILTEALTVPHPQLHLRNFVLKPMAEIAPDFKHPALGLTMSELWQKSEDKTILEEFD